MKYPHITFDALMDEYREVRDGLTAAMSGDDEYVSYSVNGETVDPVRYWMTRLNAVYEWMWEDFPEETAKTFFL